MPRTWDLADVEDVPEARYEQREAVESAFAAALQHLAPGQCRACSARCWASPPRRSRTRSTTVTSVNSALQRAHKAVDDRVSAEGEQTTTRSLEDRRVRETVQRFVDAFERMDRRCDCRNLGSGAAPCRLSSKSGCPCATRTRLTASSCRSPTPSRRTCGTGTPSPSRASRISFPSPPGTRSFAGCAELTLVRRRRTRSTTR